MNTYVEKNPHYRLWAFMTILLFVFVFLSFTGLLQQESFILFMKDILEILKKIGKIIGITIVVFIMLILFVAGG